MLTKLIGREQVLERICHQLADPACRLLTLLGGGGVGKSHLALEAAHQVLPYFPEGVFWVLLDTLQSSQSLAPLIAQAVGLELRTDSASFERSARTAKESMLAQVSGYLKGKKVLLLLDGFEQALPKTGWISTLLDQAPGLKLLVTSRARLNLDIEQIIPLEGLAYPEQVQATDLAAYEAVQLFVKSAQRLAPAFILTDFNQKAVAEICSLTQGLPLALLLAASWIDTLEPAQIVREIQHSLDFLNADWQDLPDRQRSLRATFNYSWRLLPAAEQAVFLRLAVFHSPFTLERLKQVAGASLQQLRTLIHQSLVMHASTDRNRPITHYRLHDLLRQYAQENLSASPEEYYRVHEAHCRAYLVALVEWEPRLKSRDQPAALAEIDLEYGDIIAAWNWAVDHRLVEPMEAVFEALSYYHTLRCLFREDAFLCQRAMQSLEGEPFSPLSLHLWVHISAWLSKDFIELALFERAWEVLDRLAATLSGREGLEAEMPRQLAWFHLAKGEASIYIGKNLPAQEAFQQGLELMRRGGTPWDISVGLVKVAGGLGQLGAVRETGRFAKEALSLQRELGDPHILASCLTELGFFYELSGNYQAGIQAVQEQHANLRNYDDPRSQAITHRDMGIAMFYAGQFEQARTELEKTITLEALSGLGASSKPLLYFLTCIDLHSGNYSTVLNDTAYTGLPLISVDLVGLGLFKAQIHLLEKQWKDLNWAENALMDYLQAERSLPRLDLLGMPLALLGYIAYRRGNLQGARAYLDQSLSNALQQGCYVPCLISLSVLALILAEAGELEQAAELYATVAAHPSASKSCWQADMFSKPIACLTSSLPGEILAASQEQGANRDYFEAGQERLDWLQSPEAEKFF